MQYTFKLNQYASDFPLTGHISYGFDIYRDGKWHGQGGGHKSTQGALKHARAYLRKIRAGVKAGGFNVYLSG